ncbi:NUDIX domain-containing protein [Halobacteriovorax sp. HLS]|uniref:NUDIX domain-containing protein n=1 Tax=Halobacteriovorax sp. HLS TaxID=2234000 RepID=UPI000FD9A69D|nr:NUDIX domain-containing protein [Halobacteriovorax sp. HLS]
MEEKRHKKVQVVIFDLETRSKVLLLQTKEDRDFHWQNVTGSVEDKESYVIGALRELQEETGLTGTLTELPIFFDFTDRWNKSVHEKVYLVLAPFSHHVSLCEKEHQSFKWYEADQLNNKNFGYESNWLAFCEARKWLENNN